MSLTPQALHFHLNQLTEADKFLIAFSGGIDSHVLLHLCAQLKKSHNGSAQSFSAVYVDHGLSEHSKKWGEHCQHICFELDIPLIIIAVDAGNEKRQSPESSARIARYHAFSKILTENECLLTAQHLDDQAETLLLQLLRGSGSRGLSSMPRIKQFAKGFLCRSMLDYKKQDIISYAKQHQLQWIEDESNLQQRYDRNYLRHTILPLLEQRWPAVQTSFAKSAELLGESQFLLDSMAEYDIKLLYFVNEQGNIEQDKLLLKPLLSLMDSSKKYSQQHQYARLNNVLRYWIHCNHQPLPSKKILQQIIISVIGADEDRTPLVSWKREQFHCEIRRYQDKLYLIDISNKSLDEKNDKRCCIELSENQVIKINDHVIKLMPFEIAPPENTLVDRASLKYSLLLSKKITIRFRQGGERYNYSNKSSDKLHSKSLKHWFQEHNIPPWERDKLPLIYWGDELIQVVNEIVNHSLLADEDEKSLIIFCISSDSDEISD